MDSTARLGDCGHEIAFSEKPVANKWGGILAGTFLIMAILLMLGELGAAVGLSAFEPGDRVAPYAWGAGAWALIAGIVAFFLGGAGASCFSSLHVPRRGALHGVWVWAVAVPTIGFLGAILALGAATAGGVTTAAAVAVDEAAGGTVVPDARAAEEARRARVEATRPENIRQAAKTAGAAGWAMVAAMLLCLAAAVAGGAVGARYGHRLKGAPEGAQFRAPDLGEEGARGMVS